MKNTIGKKILLIIFIPFMIIFGCLSAYIMYTISDYVTNWAELEIKSISEINATDIEGRMFSVRMSVAVAAQALEVLDPRLPNARIQADGIVRSLFSNHHVYNSWLAFEPNAFDGKDYRHKEDYPGAPSGRFLLSYVMEEGEIIVAPDMDEEELDDINQSPWYVVPRDNDTMHIDIDDDMPNLYDYGVDDDPVYTLSVVAPVHRNDQVIGCVGADVLFDDMTIGIGGHKSAVAVFYPDGRIFYTDNIDFAEESVHTLGFTNTEQIIEAIEGGTSLFLPKEYSIFLDEDAFTYFQPINIAGSENALYLYVATSRAAALNVLNPLFILIAVIMAAAMLVVYAMYTYASRRISKPLRQLTLAADAISQGDLETEIASLIEAKDELGLMSRSLHRMVEQFRVYIIRLEQAQTEMSIHTKMSECFRSYSNTPEILSNIITMLYKHIGIFKGSIITVNSGIAHTTAYYDAETAPEGIVPHNQEFPYHGQVKELLAGKKLLFMNTFTLAEQDISFTDPLTISACLVPLRVDNTLQGYLLLENCDKYKPFGMREESLLLHVADLLSAWLVERHSQTDNMCISPTLQEEPSAPEGEEEGPDLLTKLRAIEGLDVDSALESMGGLANVYDQSVRLFTRLIPSLSATLEEYLENDNIEAFAIDVHGLKGSLKNVGAYDLGNRAENFERESKAGNSAYCQENYASFQDDLLSFQKDLSRVLTDLEQVNKEPGTIEQLLSALGEIKEAAENYNAPDALETANQLKTFIFGQPLDSQLEEMIQALEIFDCEKALTILEDMQKQSEEG